MGAAIEYAVEVLHVPTITVCGHSGCGAVRALMTGDATADLGRWIAQSATIFHDIGDERACCIANVVQQLANLRTYPVVCDAVDAGRLTLTGLYFDLAEARMYEVDPRRGTTRPLASPIPGGHRH